MNARRAGLAALLAATLAGARLSAQSIILSNPEAWTQSRVVTIGVGDSLRVTGTALHPGGIGSVQVGGVSATLQRGDFASAADFAISFPVPDTLTRVVIRVNPNSGSPYEEGFPVEFRPAVRIQVPREWTTGSAVVATEGDRVTVSGVAIHPSGVRSVSVVGREATLDRNARFTHRVGFSVTFVAAPGETDAVVRVVPDTGAPFETRYAWVVRAAPAQPPAGGGTGPLAGAQPPAPAAATTPSAWAGMKKRSLGYGAAAAVGVGLAMVVTTKETERCEAVGTLQDCFHRLEEKPAYRAVGLGLIGAAAIAATIDAVRTSKRASASTTRTGSTGLRVEPPSISPDGGRVAVSLLRLRF